MNQTKLFSVLLIVASSFLISACGPSIKTTGSWVNKTKISEEPLKSVFIIALTDNRTARTYLENYLAEAAQKRGLKAYRSVEFIGPVDLKQIAPVKEVFLKKLSDLNCESIFTVALVNSTSDTRYVSGSAAYSPYSYGAYGGYGGYGAHGAYGGFGGYYGYTVSTMGNPGYYTTDNKYFIEAKLFDFKTDELLMSVQSKATNPDAIEKSSKLYTETLMEEVDKLRKQYRKK